MFGPRSSIYVSFNNSHEYVKGSSGKYAMQPKPIWMLSVEPQKHRLPGTHKPTEPKHFTARFDETWKEYALQSIAPTNLGMAGSIMITQNANVTPEDVTQNLRAKLANALNLPLHLATPAGSEHWIRLALHNLMHDGIIESFDVEEFMTFARAYLGDRLDQTSGPTSPAVVSYAKLRKASYKKPKSQGMWLSYPMANASRGGDKIYGGLM